MGIRAFWKRSCGRLLFTFSGPCAYPRTACLSSLPPAHADRDKPSYLPALTGRPFRADAVLLTLCRPMIVISPCRPSVRGCRCQRPRSDGVRVLTTYRPETGQLFSALVIARFSRHAVLFRTGVLPTAESHVRTGAAGALAPAGALPSAFPPAATWRPADLSYRLRGHGQDRSSQS